MKIYTAGTIEDCASAPPSRRPLEIILNPWCSIIDGLTKGRDLRPVQRAALEEFGILDSRQHVVVCAPTNSGKTVVGYMVLIEALLRNQNALLIEPLRALAQEKSDELEVLLNDLSPGVFPSAPKVRLTTRSEEHTS